MPRETLYRRIDDRVDGMVAEGLEREARALYPLRDCNALQTVGYREFFGYFDGKITRDKAIELIKRNSRRYAKRQQTWFAVTTGSNGSTAGRDAPNRSKSTCESLYNPRISLYLRSMRRNRAMMLGWWNR